MQNSVPLSPIKAKRREEKSKLQNLNTRLANYALRVGEKWNETQSLTDELQQVHLRHSKELEEIRNRYEKDLQRLQADLDEETDQRARLQVLEQDQFLELKNLRPQAEQAKELRVKVELQRTQLKAEEEKSKGLEGELTNAKVEISALKRKSSSLEKENKKFTSANQRLHNENATLKKEVAKFTTRNEEEIAELRKENAMKLEAMQVQFKQDNQERLDKISAELNQHYSNMIVQNENRINELTKENEGIKKELMEVSKDLEKSLAAHQESVDQTKALEFEIRVERMKRKDERNLLESDLHQARQARIDLEKRFNELMDVKIALDAEITAYNAILEREETRVGIETPRKRPRSPEDDSESARKQRRTVPATIHLVNLDIQNECISIENHGDEDHDMTGWYLRTMSEDYQYVFPSGYILGAGCRLNIWSGKNNKGKQHWPTDIFWTKKFIWCSKGDAAVLLNSRGKYVSKIAKGMDFPHEVLENIEAYDEQYDSPNKNSKCMIM